MYLKEKLNLIFFGTFSTMLISKFVLRLKFWVRSTSVSCSSGFYLCFLVNNIPE